MVENVGCRKDLNSMDALSMSLPTQLRARSLVDHLFEVLWAIPAAIEMYLVDGQAVQVKDGVVT